jgi:hypothetical protein
MEGHHRPLLHPMGTEVSENQNTVRRLPSVIPVALFTVAGGVISGTTAGKAWVAPVIRFGVLS